MDACIVGVPTLVLHGVDGTIEHLCEASPSAGDLEVGATVPVVLKKHLLPAGERWDASASAACSCEGLRLLGGDVAMCVAMKDKSVLAT